MNAALLADAGDDDLPIDVETRSGRLMSLGELRRALQLVREEEPGVPNGTALAPQPAQPSQRPAVPVTTSGTCETIDPLTTAFGFEDEQPSGYQVRGRARPASSSDLGVGDEEDPFGELDLNEIGTREEPARSSSRQRRPTRNTFGRFGEKASGLDRLNSAERSKRRSTTSDVSDPLWLKDLTEQPACISTAGRRRPQPPDSRGTQPVSRHVRSDSSPVDDIEIAPAPRGFAAGLWLWVARMAIGLIFLAGLNTVFIKPFRTPTPAVVVSPIDGAASQQAAERYVSDYLSFFPGRGPAQLAALQNDAVSSAGAAALSQWGGSDYLRVDTVLAGQVVSIDPTHSVVSVAALIHLAMPPAGKPTQGASAAAVLDGADPGPVPAGWTDLGSRWLQLAVPVQATGPIIRVSAEGPAFVGETPQLVTVAAAGSQVDQGVSSGTQGVASSLLSAYASSDLSYLTAPGIALDGLHGAVTLVSVTGWSVSLPSSSPTSGTGTGLVTWQLTGTDLRITEPYSISLTNSQGRWYGAALSPNPAAQ